MTQNNSVVRRIGDQYVPMSQEPDHAWPKALAGGGLILLGLRRGGLLGWGAAFAGAGLLLSVGKTSRLAINEARKAEDQDQKADEQSEQSFPASDPPASTTSTASGNLQPQVG